MNNNKCFLLIVLLVFLLASCNKGKETENISSTHESIVSDNFEDSSTSSIISSSVAESEIDESSVIPSISDSEQVSSPDISYLQQEIKNGIYVTQYLGDMESNGIDDMNMRSCRIKDGYLYISSTLCKQNKNYEISLAYDFADRCIKLSDKFEVFTMIYGIEEDDDRKDYWKIDEFNECFDFDTYKYDGTLGLALEIKIKNNEVLSIEVIS